MISSTSSRILHFAFAAMTTVMGVSVYAQEKPTGGDDRQAPKAELVSDPATGVVYRKTVRTVEVPVYETKYVQKQQRVFRPETVTEAVPENKAVFVPETNYTWQPVLHNRWNPFVKPMITYHHVPQTQWKQQSDTVTRTQTRTKWIAENRAVSVPTQVVSLKRQEKVEFEPVGRVAIPQATPPNSISEAIAARMRPIDSRTAVVPIGTARQPLGRVQPPPFIDLSAIARGRVAPQASAFVPRPSTTSSPTTANANAQNRTYNVGSNIGSGQNAIAARNSAVTPPRQAAEVYGRAFGNTPYGISRPRDQFNANRIAASTVGRLTSDPPRRNVNQGGLRPTDLRPGRGYGQALPPATQPSGIANLPTFLWR